MIEAKVPSRAEKSNAHLILPNRRHVHLSAIAPVHFHKIRPRCDAKMLPHSEAHSARTVRLESRVIPRSRLLAGGADPPTTHNLAVQQDLPWRQAFEAMLPEQPHSRMRRRIDELLMQGNAPYTQSGAALEGRLNGLRAIDQAYAGERCALLAVETHTQFTQ